MNRVLALTSLSVVLASCSSPTATLKDAEAKTVEYNCDNGQQVTLHFPANSATALLERLGNKIPLTRQDSDSGFVFSNGPNTVKGNDQEIRVEIGRMMPIRCVVGDIEVSS